MPISNASILSYLRATGFYFVKPPNIKGFILTFYLVFLQFGEYELLNLCKIEFETIIRLFHRLD